MAEGKRGWGEGWKLTETNVMERKKEIIHVNKKKKIVKLKEM